MDLSNLFMLGIIVLAISPVDVQGVGSPIIGVKCNVASDCLDHKINDPNVTCTKGECACRHNFDWDNGCKPFDCKRNRDCQDLDGQRFCHNSNCICQDYFYEDPDSDLCVPKALGGACVSTDDCLMSGVPNTHCIKRKCRCVAGYRLHLGQCKEFNCTFTIDCHVFDKNWECLGGKCIELPGAEFVYLNEAGVGWVAIALIVTVAFALFLLLFHRAKILLMS